MNNYSVKRFGNTDYIHYADLKLILQGILTSTKAIKWKLFTLKSMKMIKYAQMYRKSN